MARRSPSPPPFGLVLGRIAVGYVLLAQGWGWLKAESLDGGDVRAAVESAVGGLAAPLAWWGEELVLANPDASAFFWRWGAFLVGLSFVTGTLVRPLGTIGTVLLLHGLAFGPARDAALFLVLGACALGCVLADAGHRLGLDALIEDRLPAWVTWRRGSARSLFS